MRTRSSNARPFLYTDGPGTDALRDIGPIGNNAIYIIGGRASLSAQTCTTDPINSDEADLLTVSNLGSSGQDGVRIKPIRLDLPLCSPQRC